MKSCKIYENCCRLCDFCIYDKKYTGLLDGNSKPIKIGDTVRLILEDGEVRDFKVAFKTVKRRIFTHPDFDDETTEVYITGVVFEWNGYDLFPCAGVDGISDTSRMEII